MSDPVIRVERLSKKYLLRHEQRERYTALRDVIAGRFRSLGRGIRARVGASGGMVPTLQPAREDFWALRDVSFEIQQGERIGIIGRNGAGKSTLLKILSRITEPTTGRIELEGRVASLLEVGTGFHPELTGRENIFLNGAILGMGRGEIRRKFDEIVAFAEVEKFLDTPVKRFSSGMYVRLAFAVAAHLEPEILVVDEVLAVGDVQFQRKCLGKMKDAGRDGRTVLFVSHNMSAVQQLCSRCLILEKGKMTLDAVTATAVQTFLTESGSSDHFIRHDSATNDPHFISGDSQLLEEAAEPRLLFELVIESGKERQVSLDLRLANAIGVPVGFASLGAFDPDKLISLRAGVNQLSLVLPLANLATGRYFVSLDLTLPDREYYDRLENCFSFEIFRDSVGRARRVLAQSWGYGSLEFGLRVRETA